MGAWQLISTAASPVLKVCLLASIGALLARKVGSTAARAAAYCPGEIKQRHTLTCTLPAVPMQGILDVPGSATAARLSFYVFTPALTFSKLVQAVSLNSIAHLWPLLANL